MYTDGQFILLFFTLGLCAQLAIIVFQKGTLFLKLVFSTLFLSLFSPFILYSFPLDHDLFLSPMMMIPFAIVTLFFLSLCILLLQKVILKPVTEYQLLCWLVIFWFVVWGRFGFPIWGFAVLVPTVVSLWIIFVKTKLDEYWRIFLYCWYLGMLLFVSMTQMYSFFQGGWESVSWSSAFLEGMFAFYVLSHLLILIFLVPWNSSGKHWMKTKQQAALLGSFYLPMQYKFSGLLLYAVVVILLLLLNKQYVWISEAGMIACILLVTEYFFPWIPVHKE